MQPILFSCHSRACPPADVHIPTSTQKGARCHRPSCYPSIWDGLVKWNKSRPSIIPSCVVGGEPVLVSTRNPKTGRGAPSPLTSPPPCPCPCPRPQPNPSESSPVLHPVARLACAALETISSKYQLSPARLSFSSLSIDSCHAILRASPLTSPRTPTTSFHLDLDTASRL